MKKIYISVFALVVSISSIAQVLNLKETQLEQQLDEKKSFY